MSTTGTAAFDIAAYLARSGALDLSAIDWAAVPRHPLSPEAIRTLKYMQDIESHTIVYLRSLLATRAIDDPDVARFLAAWVYEESFHGLALERFLAAAGHPVGPHPTPRGHESPAQWLESRLTALLSRVWPDFCAVHMTWGAINELSTLTGYRRLAARAGHPVLSELLDRIARDESRHFFFYFRQAEIRLQRPAVARVARPPGGPLLGPRGERRPAAARASLHGELPLFRPAGARRGPQGRRDNTQATRLRNGRIARKLARPIR
jgi:hypothetical protein